MYTTHTQLSIDNKTDVNIMTEDELIEFYIKENKRVDTSAPEAEESQIVEEEDETEAAVKIFLSLHSPYLQRPKPPTPSSSSTSSSSSSASMLSSPIMSLAAAVSWMTDRTEAQEEKDQQIPPTNSTTPKANQVSYRGAS